MHVHKIYVLILFMITFSLVPMPCRPSQLLFCITCRKACNKANSPFLSESVLCGGPGGSNFIHVSDKNVANVKM